MGLQPNATISNTADRIQSSVQTWFTRAISLIVSKAILTEAFEDLVSSINTVFSLITLSIMFLTF